MKQRDHNLAAPGLDCLRASTDDTLLAKGHHHCKQFSTITTGCKKFITREMHSMGCTCKCLTMSFPSQFKLEIHGTYFQVRVLQKHLLCAWFVHTNAVTAFCLIPSVLHNMVSLVIYLTHI